MFHIIRILEEDADVDEDVAKLLDGTDSDPDKIREKMKMELQNKELFASQQGADTPPAVTFRDINPFKLWVSTPGLATKKKRTGKDRLVGAGVNVP
eukprot:1161585-Pelagomonas_calceolata.AAC.5